MFRFRRVDSFLCARILCRTAVLALGLFGFTGNASALTAYALTAANQLLVFDTGAPATILATIAITGLQPGETIKTIDFRPLDGQLYGVGSTSRLYRIHMTTGVATALGAGPFTNPALNPNATWDMDFNPSSGWVRVMSTELRNVVIDPETATQIDFDPSTPAVDQDGGSNDGHFAYADNFVGAADSQLYLLHGNSLFRMVLARGIAGGQFLGAPSVTFQTVDGFDIAPHADEAFIIGTVGGIQGLYTFDLSTRAATPVGLVGSGSLQVRALALQARPARLWAATTFTLFGGIRLPVLVTFNSARPDTVITYLPLSGLFFDDVIGVDVRPATGELYALGHEGRLYKIDTTTGFTTPVSSTSFPTTFPVGPSVGMDFDPVTDTLRIVDPSGRNLRVNPDTGALVAQDMNLSATGDYVPGIAYGPYTPGGAQPTLYGFNANDGTLVTIGGPGGAPSANTGQMFDVGAFGFSGGTGGVGFDISDADGTGFFAEFVGAQSLLRTVNLTSGRARDVGVIGSETMVGLTTAPIGRLRFTSTMWTAGESSGDATITIERVQGTSGPISMNYTVTSGTGTAGAGPGADLAAASGTLILLDGETSKTFAIPIVSDTLDEPDETATVTLSHPLLGTSILGSPTATLTIVDDDLPPALEPPAITITAPSSSGTFTTTADTVEVSGTATDNVAVQTVSWSNDRGGSGVAPGTTAWSIAALPLQPGVNVITVVATDTQGLSASATLSVMRTGTALTYVLAEGATGSFFQTEIALANPSAVPAPVQISYLKEAGGIVTQTLTLAAMSHRLISVATIPGMEAAAFSTVVESTDGVPIVVERTMAWDATRYGAHTDAAAAGSASTWYFAEGAQGFFHTYLLLANSAAAVNTATVEFLLEGSAQTVTKTYDLAPSSRLTIYTGDVPELVDRSFGIVVKFAVPGVAERAIYFGGPPLFNGGHESLGVTAPNQRWFHAEGATGSFFDTFLLLANPGAAVATVTLRYLPASGIAVTTTKTIPAHSRLTVNVELEHPSLADAAVATEVTSDQPIISERSMYWPGTGATWHEAHNSFGVTSTSTKWGLAEGRVGGPTGYQTYILLANPSDTATAHVTITFLRDDGTTVVKTCDVSPGVRVNVPVGAQVPELSNEGFGALITSDQPIFVERAMYSDAHGVTWAAGTVATATRLP
jgi:hypothetical protein